jgi:ferredoxin
MTRVIIDREGCVSCGTCWDDCPEFFEQNQDDNLSQVVEKYRTGGLGEGEAPDDLLNCVIDASDACPAEVIHVS